MTKVLVTGASGFIGSHLVESLVRDGVQVRALVRYNSQGRTGWLEDLASDVASGVETVFGDLRDQDSVDRAVRGTSAVFHLGAMISIPFSYIAPQEAMAVNTQGTFHVLKACRDQGVTRMIHTSTSEVYGTAQTVPMNEDHRLQGQSPYSASKIGADQLVESFFRSFNAPVVTVRPFNTYGPRQSSRAIIPTILSQWLTGQTLELGSLHPTRDFTFVSDTVEGFKAAWKTDGVCGQTMNLGTGSEISIEALVREIGAVLVELGVGTASQFSLESVRTKDTKKRPPASEVERLLSDPSKAEKWMGWRHRVKLRDGLKTTALWLQSRLRSVPQATGSRNFV